MKEIHGDKVLVIAVPDGDIKNQYLWFGNKDGRYVGSVSHKAKLKKLKRWIDEILGPAG